MVVSILELGYHTFLFVQVGTGIRCSALGFLLVSLGVVRWMMYLKETTGGGYKASIRYIGLL